MPKAERSKRIAIDTTTLVSMNAILSRVYDRCPKQVEEIKSLALREIRRSPTFRNMNARRGNPKARIGELVNEVLPLALKSKPCLRSAKVAWKEWTRLTKS